MTTRIAVVGAGYWGKNLIRHFHQLGVLYSICDVDEQRLHTLRQNHTNTRIVNSYAEVLRDPNVDAVVVATPAELHGSLTRDALQAGKDVFVEKPLCLSLSEGRELVSLALSKRRVLMVGHLLWYHPAVLRLKELIDSGELGRLQYIYANRLNLGRIRREENILWSFAPHDISVILGLLGEMPRHVSAKGGRYLHERIDDVTVTWLSFPSGVKAHIFVSWLHPYKEHKLVVSGDKKMAVFDDTAPDDKLALFAHSISWKHHTPEFRRAERETVSVTNDEPLRLECRHFLDCVERRLTPRTNGDEGLRVLTVLEECQEALDVQLVDKIRRPKHFLAHEASHVEDDPEIGPNSRICDNSHVEKGATLGANCSLGYNCFVDAGVVVGNDVTVENNVSIYKSTVIEDDVVLGPSCVVSDMTTRRLDEAPESPETLIRRGATIGPNVTVASGVQIGRHAFVAAGAVVTESVPAYGLVAGNPARRIGWMGRHGRRLRATEQPNVLVCPISQIRYEVCGPNEVKCLEGVDEASESCGEAEGKRRFLLDRKAE